MCNIQIELSQQMLLLSGTHTKQHSLQAFTYILYTDSRVRLIESNTGKISKRVNRQNNISENVLIYIDFVIYS